MKYETHWEFLKSSASLQKLSHAYLFSGNDAGSQRQLAVLFSQFLNCESKKGEKPCARCLSCTMVQSRSHPDVLWIEGIREIPISSIRNLHHRLSLSAWQSRFKIAVIEGAHLMNQEAQSALLKNLEEPKPNTVFLLLTCYPNLLLETIRSRAQELRWYVFSSKPQDNTIQKEQEQLARLKNSLLQERFDFAKRTGETSQDVAETLLQWMEVQRTRFLAALPDPDKEVIAKEEKTLKIMQEMLHAVQTTNVTPRLALEQVLLAL